MTVGRDQAQLVLNCQTISPLSLLTFYSSIALSPFYLKNICNVRFVSSFLSPVLTIDYIDQYTYLACLKQYMEVTNDCFNKGKSAGRL